MKGIRVTSLMMIMMVVMTILVSPSHAKAVDFNISCFLKCATGCLSKSPALPCIFKCLTSCIAPSPSPTPKPPMPPKPPLPPKPPMPPKPPATPPTSPVRVPMSSLAGLKSCNFKCAIRVCTSIETDMEKINCMENCFRSDCEDN
ncbi:hypothetical protein POM88_016152 [Heracleum sosnowskyi]|uniref:Uncharacterized protein n=1 Tax=Heracleum sosnowskyi TaxID=360622 RepID=A0AAD8INE9_9APIA|nr:hypothetical protein POM88_016151 [Heracleum sosnowskyi]KAK1387974.1 hypothetical protein POM88_016152 [Heracleum sosnowskyi]